MELVLCAMIAAAVAALATWLAMRTRTATLQERLSARDSRIAELDARLAESSQARQELAMLETRLVEERKAAAEKHEMLREAQVRLSDAFKALSADALKSNNETFLNLARATLEKFQEGARGDLEKRQLAIDQLMKPVQETLSKFDLKIGEIEKSRIEAYGGLSQQVKGLATTQQSLQRETSNLVKALGSPGVRGRWGEIQLRRVVEIAGMLEFCDFRPAGSISRRRKARCGPTWWCGCRVEKALSLTRKRPWTAYLEAIEAPDEASRQAKLAEHARSIREHMIALGKKGYWEQFQPAPEFVVLFLPGEIFTAPHLSRMPRCSKSKWWLTA